MASLEPPNPNDDLPPILFFIGKDHHGNWVVQDRQHLHGGLFHTQEQARKFALSENGNRPDYLVVVPGSFDLDVSPGAPDAQPEDYADRAKLRRVA